MTTPLIFPDRSMPVLPAYDWHRAGGHDRPTILRSHPDGGTAPRIDPRVRLTDHTGRDGGWMRHPPQIRLALQTPEDVAALVAEVNAAEPEKRARAAAREREVRRGQTVCAIVVIAFLLYISIWLGPDILLP